MPRALEGPGKITHRNRIQGRLLWHLFTHAKKTAWFLGLYPDYQPNRVVVELAGLT